MSDGTGVLPGEQPTGTAGPRSVHSDELGSETGPTPRPAGPTGHTGAAWHRGGPYAVATMLVSVVLLQRFGVPAGEFVVPIILPLGLLLIAGMVVMGWVRASVSRAVLFGVASGALCVAAYAATLRTGQLAPASLLLLLVVFSPWVLQASGSAAAKARGALIVGNAYVSLMVLAAGVALAQMLSQLLGVWSYEDLLQSSVPADFLIPDYNTSIPTAYASPIFKSQAFVFLEPSIYSQFTALAIIVAVLQRRPMWMVMVLAAGLVTALSGTGLLLLGAGLIFVVLRAPRTIRVGYLLAGVVAVALALASPAADLLIGRVDEAHQPTSSLGLRFVLPYQEVATGMSEDPLRWVTGAGPASADRLLESDNDGAGLAVVYTAPAKLIFEYGLLPAALFLLFMLTALFRKPPRPALPSALLFQICFLGGYLVAPHALWTAWCLSVVWARHD